MRNDLILDLAECTEFRRALRSRAPRIVHGTAVLLVLLMAAGVSQGVTRVDRTDVFDVFITDAAAVGTGAENLVSVDLCIVNTTGDPGHNPAAFDGTYFGYTGITGVLHQHYSEAFGFDSPLADSPSYATDMDTHFLATSAELLAISGPEPTEAVSTLSS